MRLAELMGTMAVATNAGMGIPDDHAIRAAILASGIAGEIGASDADRSDAYYVTLLRFAGCTADSDVASHVMGDEVAVRGAMYGVDFFEAGEFLPFLVRTVGRELPLPARALRLARTVARLPAFADAGRSHCEVGDRLATRFGFGARSRDALFQVFERWNGRGVPRRLRGEAIALPTRIATVAVEAEMGHRVGGVEGAVALVRKRSRRALDPRLVEAFARAAPALCAPLGGTSTWSALLEAEPTPHRAVDDEGLDEALRAMGHFADLKSRYTRGHSDGVAALARAAAAAARLGDGDATLLERAARVHDLGRVCVSVALWDRPGPLSDGEWERVRLHPYQTERIFARSASLAPLGETAALAHERLDGRGYHRRLPAAALDAPARLLAAADAYHAMTEPRAHRPARSPDEACDELRREARAGRLDGEMVEATLAAAGHARARVERPAGLSDREVEVLRLVARGLTNKEIATALGISTKTAGHHVQHIFDKIDVTTRAAASMFAMQHALA